MTAEPQRGARRRIAAAEEGRRRVAREVHDDFSQRLAALAFSLRGVCGELAEGDPRRVELDGIGGGLAELGEDLRRLSHDLHPATLERLGLAAALRDHCAEIERRHGPRVAFSLTGSESSFPPETALGLYRIAQEALANTVRHAGASTASVVLRATANTAFLTVADDGRGFAPEAARRSGGVGLASLEERAGLLGGRCRVRSSPGAGTRVEVTVPLPAEGTLFHLRELARRHRNLVVSTALVILALAAGFVTTLIQARRRCTIRARRTRRGSR
jgi:signal transduction histidine kinase